MDYMKKSFIIFFLIIFNRIYSQEPIVSYCFKAFDKMNKEITESNNSFQFRSLSLKGIPETINDTIKYSKTDCSGKCPVTKYWEIFQEYKGIRNYLWIQIINTLTNDTMNIFIEKRGLDMFYDDYEDYSKEPYYFNGKALQLDSIGFQNGNFLIKDKPKYFDWKNLRKNITSENIEKLNGRLEVYLKKNFDINGYRRK